MTHRSKAPHRWLRATAAGLAAVSAAALIAACGGSTSQFEPFVAQRVFAFGDDLSALRSDGRRFGINGIATPSGGTPAFDCNLEPLWVQVVAGFYGLVFAECNTATPPAEPRAFMHAAGGAKVADVVAQVSARVAAGGFREKDLALVLAGMNDVFELYAQYPARSEEDLKAEARARGALLAEQVVNRLIDGGARVIVANLPDLGLTPYARAEAATHAASGFDRAAFITRLTEAFNETLGVKVRLDGRFVGLAQFDLRTQQIGRFSGGFGFVDVSSAACAVAPPDCTTQTLVSGATSGGWLWADDRRLSGGGQGQLAQLALDRAQRNPF